MAFDGLNCRWYVKKTNPEYIDYISKIASVSPACSQILINRGVKTPEQIELFLNPDIQMLSDPFELQGMKKAIERIIKARKENEKILICGDYDADGLTATSILLEGLRKLSIDADYFIPDRFTDGYGFGDSGLDRAKDIGANLIITVDCGISSFDAVKRADKLGIEVIITDHHEPVRAPNEEVLLPDAFVVVNPKILPCSYSQSFLSGAGVAFKIVQALFGNGDDTVEFLDLAALGTAADIVPLLGDNRIFVKKGIDLIQSGERAGIRALKSATGIRQDFFKPTFLSFVLVPRLNAAGRMSNARNVVRLLTTKSEAEAEELALWLNDLNSQRQKIEEIVYNEAIQLIGKTDFKAGAIVAASEGWHEGVIGIVAARLADEYYRPAFVFSVRDNILKGSARSIPAFDIYAGLVECRDLLEGFGGHRQAAGISLHAEMLGDFRQRISDFVLSSLGEEDLIPCMNIDVSVRIADINAELINELSRLEPFGTGNDEPLFGAKGLEPYNPRIVGNNHLKMFLKQNGRGIDSIGFDFGRYLELVGANALIDAAFYPTINEWDGGRYLQLNLKAIRLAKNENND
jgi:single-stranded-DNA-specific exonuclease